MRLLGTLQWEDWPDLRKSLRAVVDLPIASAVLCESRIGQLLSDAPWGRHLGPFAPFRNSEVELWQDIACQEPVSIRARSATAAALGRAWKPPPSSRELIHHNLGWSQRVRRQTHGHLFIAELQVV